MTKSKYNYAAMAALNNRTVLLMHVTEDPAKPYVAFDIGKHQHILDICGDEPWMKPQFKVYVFRRLMGMD